VLRPSSLLGPLILIVASLAGAQGLAVADNPYGVMLFPNPGEDVGLALARARGLGVTWFRPPTIDLEAWKIGTRCGQCAAYLRSGLKLAIAVRNTGEASDRQPSRPPADVAAFRKSFAAVLAAWHPSLVAVESEENSPTAFDGVAKPVQAYAAELAAACAVAHEAKVACTNGGLTGDAAAGLAWLGFLAAGKPDRACDFAKRALPGEKLCAFRAREEVPAALRDRMIGIAEPLVQLYREADIDAVNFHWFGADSRAFAETAEFLAGATGKPAITNEFGQRRGAADPDAVRPLLRAALAEGVRVAIWYSVDTVATVSLFGPDGRLRPSGWEFQRQLSGLR